MGNQRLTFFIILGLYRDYTAPKRLKVTNSTTRLRLWIRGLWCRVVVGPGRVWYLGPSYFFAEGVILKSQSILKKGTLFQEILEPPKTGPNSQ